eukprot:6192395-Pleurochrysis_carterae.AAC.3
MLQLRRIRKHAKVKGRTTLWEPIPRYGAPLRPWRYIKTKGERGARFEAMHQKQCELSRHSTKTSRMDSTLRRKSRKANKLHRKYNVN